MTKTPQFFTQNDILRFDSLACTALPDARALEKTGYTRQTELHFGKGCAGESATEQPEGEERLNKKDDGDTEGEFQMPGLMAEKTHRPQGFDAATGDGKPDEAVLRDAPASLAGLPLVYTVQEEGHQVDAHEVYDKNPSHRIVTLVAPIGPKV